jgi:Holliday junction DNA helicase RuvA
MTGILVDVDTHAITVDREGLVYEVLVPGYAIGELAALRGRTVTLYTLEFFEGNAASGNLVPRVLGFLHPEDRLFFNRFVGVKGIGPRKALKALSEPIGRIAGWINDGDTKSLSKLPGIGQRAAQMIVAELAGKLDAFAVAQLPEAMPEIAKWTSEQRDALDVMVAWGDARNEVERWLARTAQVDPDLASPEEWVRACYRLKTAGERQ